jgi:hypothetical protein
VLPPFSYPSPVFRDHATGMRGLFPWSLSCAFFVLFSAGKSPVAFVLHLTDNLTDW